MQKRRCGGQDWRPPLQLTQHVLQRRCLDRNPVGKIGDSLSETVQYRGRGAEWFEAEVPTMFEWMARKRRTTPVTQLGRFGQQGLGDEFQSMRATDNRFYWITSEAISPNCLNRVPGWSARVLPARLQASINPGMNTIYISQTGFRQLTVWLARDARLDFDKPVTVRVNGDIVVSNRKVQPSLVDSEKH